MSDIISPMSQTGVGILLVNFGGPRSKAELEPFLTRLFDDVLPLSNAPSQILVPSVPKRWFQLFSAALKYRIAIRVAKRRALQVVENYAAIGWSPIVPDTDMQRQILSKRLGPNPPPIAIGMLFTEPSIRSALIELQSAGIDRLVVLGLFPHFSFATTAAAYNRVAEALVSLSFKLPVHYIPAFYDHPKYLEAVRKTIENAVQKLEGSGPIDLVFSAHGLPLYLVRQSDPYPDQIRETVRRVTDELDWNGTVHLAWQSRVGPTKWLEPNLLDLLTELAKCGSKRVIVVPISFVGEHIETLHELDIEVAHHAKSLGITHFGRATTVGHCEDYQQAIADIVQKACAQFTKYRCVRCLIEKPSEHRYRAGCKNCGFKTPIYLRSPQAWSNKSI